MSSEIDNKYVISKLGDEYYGIPINNVISIEKMGTTTRVPNAPKYVTGVTNLRGEVVPIINLRKKLDMEEHEADKNSRIVIVNVDNIVAGLTVDSSSEVLEIHKDNIDKPPSNENNQFVEYVSGIGKTSDKLIILLNLRKILEY